jgi:hypothetical protein
MRTLALALLLLWSCSTYASQRNLHEPKLAVVVRSAKPTYRLTEEIELEIQLSNAGDEPFIIRRQLGWGVGRTQIRVFDSNGKEVFTPFLADELPPPPKEHDFVELGPNEFFGVRMQEPTTHFVSTPGSYELVVDYSSHLSEQWIRTNVTIPDVPIWSREMGTVESNRITVIIAK